MPVQETSEKTKIVKINDDLAEVQSANGDDNIPPLKMLLFTKEEIEITFKLLREIRSGVR